MSSPSLPPALEARQLTLPKLLHTPSPQISSILFDPLSNSLALPLSDSSFSLYPSFSPFSTPFFPSPKALIPSPTSAAAFLHLRSKSTAATATLFVTSSPLLRPAFTLLRFYILRNDRFDKIKVISNHRDLEFDGSKFGVVFEVNHGVSMKLSGGINVFALHSISSSKIWVFAVKLIGDDGAGGEALKLMKCAVIDCCIPVFAIRVLFGFLFLGEENGVRVFPLHQLVKGNHKKEKRNTSKRSNLRNGAISLDAAKTGNGGTDGELNLLSVKGEKKSVSAKLRSMKLKQDSRDVGALFVAFKYKDVKSPTSTKMPKRAVKSICIEALSANYFVVLDSIGDVHLLCLSSSVQGPDSPCSMKQLTQTMKVRKLAVFPEVSTVTQTIWMSDGCHTVHRMMVSDLDNSFDKTEKKDSEEKLIQTSVTQAIFSSENIQDIVALGANAVLVLGQGNMFAYSIS